MSFNACKSFSHLPTSDCLGSKIKLSSLLERRMIQSSLRKNSLNMEQIENPEAHQNPMLMTGKLMFTEKYSKTANSQNYSKILIERQENLMDGIHCCSTGMTKIYFMVCTYKYGLKLKLL